MSWTRRGCHDRLRYHLPHLHGWDRPGGRAPGGMAVEECPSCSKLTTPAAVITVKMLRRTPGPREGEWLTAELSGLKIQEEMEVLS